MADIIPKNIPESVINSADNYVYGNADNSLPSTWLFHGVASSFVGTGLVVKGRKANTTATFLPIPYVRRYVSAAASDDTVVSAALSGTFIIKVDATGLDISLDNTTGYTSGSFTVYAKSLSGAAA